MTTLHAQPIFFALPRISRRTRIAFCAGVVATALVAIAYQQATVARPAGPWLERQTALLLGPPAVKMEEAFATTAPAAAEFDHSAFDMLLKNNVDAGGLVNYAALKNDTTVLDEYIARVGKADCAAMSRDQRLAFFINAYNAFTLRLILDHYPIKSIKDIPENDRWAAVRWNIDGRVLSLNQVEHEEIRPKFKEPRIHFALVCAAVGCPPLRSEAFTADKLEQQLDSQTKYVHSHPTWFVYDDAAKTLKLTSLYNWYGGDFEQMPAGSVVKFAAQYSPALKQALDQGQAPAVEFLTYDWSLNTQR